MTLSLITPAATLPVSLASVKAHARVEDASFDVLLEKLRKAAIGHVERYLGRALGEQTWRLTLDQFSDAIELDRGPVLSIVANSFKYYDVNGDQQIVPAELYSLDLVSDPAWIVRNEGASWPSTVDAVNAVQVDFNAGWTEALLPPEIDQAVCMIATAWFEDSTAKVPQGALDLIQPWRTLWIAA